ncbi:RNA methyltransferase tRNA(m5U54)methyltransferase [Massospora cicadina]|nr:RNA methyltransferase tRNA(m5U54)methyltransferase [Massospora cicadina]
MFRYEVRKAPGENLVSGMGGGWASLQPYASIGISCSFEFKLRRLEFRGMSRLTQLKLDPTVKGASECEGSGGGGGSAHPSNQGSEPAEEKLPYQLREGKATILFPSENEVFYNPVQEFNRDMSIAAIQTFIHTLVRERRERHIRRFKALNDGLELENDTGFDEPRPTILEALAATGLRSIRYAKEIRGVGPILANDLEPQAVEAILKNLAFNGVAEPTVTANLGDANDVMYSHRHPERHFDIIDLDPYGSASPFVDAAVQSVADGGLLCVTCTDLAVLASPQHSETCYAKYGGVPVRAGFCHEAALRLVIHLLMSSAARYKRAIQPLVSCSIDFYVRIFVRVVNSAAQVKFNASNTSMVFKCSGCGAYKLSPVGRMLEVSGAPKFGPSQGPPVDSRCQFCHAKHHMAGPMYSGPLHNKQFVADMLRHVQGNRDSFKTGKRMEGMLTVISELASLMVELSSVVRAPTPDYLTLVSALLHLGYLVSSSHCTPGSLKTDAPPDAVWDAVWREGDKFPAGAPGVTILAAEPTRAVDFTLHPQANFPSRKIKLVRYQLNPEKNWGPKSRHRRQGDGHPAKKQKPAEIVNGGLDA